MATISGYTKEWMDEIANDVIVSAAIVDGHLVFTKHDTSTLDVGMVQGEQGETGPEGPPGTTPVLPPGVVAPYAGTTAPTGYLLCDGQAVSRSTYSGLFAVTSTIYGAGDGSTTFNVPSVKGRSVFGRDAAQTEFDVLGETGGAKTHLLTTGELPIIRTSEWPVDMGAGVTVDNWVASPGTAFSILPPLLILNFIIKT